MALKKKAASKEAPKKRIKPVVEEVVEETVETPKEEVANEVVEGTAVGTSDENIAEEPAETIEDSSPETIEEISAPEAPVPAVEELASPQAANTSSNRMSIKTILFITLISALVAAFVSGGVYVYLTGVNDMKVQTEAPQEESEDTQPQATPSPTPEPAEDVDFSDYSVQVLNGSGQIGAAGAGSDLVESKGFVVDDTGNADNYDYENTVVQVKSDVPESVTNAVVESLKEEYEVEVGDKLEDDSEYDIVVIVGSN